MEIVIPNRLSTLGHPQRLALFRLLMRRYPDCVPATELAQALGLKPNTLSTYVNALMQAGLISQERIGTSLRSAIDMDAARETVEPVGDVDRVAGGHDGESRYEDEQERVDVHGADEGHRQLVESNTKKTCNNTCVHHLTCIFMYIICMLYLFTVTFLVHVYD